MEFVVELPLPPASLSPNARVHWAVKAKATRTYREACYVLTHIAKPKGWKAGPVTIVTYSAFRGCGGYHAKDSANGMASIKAVPDAMVDAGVMPSDATKWLRWGSFNLISTQRACKGKAGLVVRVKAGG